MRMQRDCNAMCDDAKFCPCVLSTCAPNGIISFQHIWDWMAMGDAAKFFPRIPSACAQIVILS
jgi:hypothetical protein